MDSEQEHITHSYKLLHDLIVAGVFYPTEGD